MSSCWHSEPKARLSFTQLQYSFKSIIAASNTDTTANYITVQPSNSYAFVLLSEPFGGSSQNLKPAVPYERLSAAM